MAAAYIMKSYQTYKTNVQYLNNIQRNIAFSSIYKLDVLTNDSGKVFNKLESVIQPGKITHWLQS